MKIKVAGLPSNTPKLREMPLVPGNRLAAEPPPARVVGAVTGPHVSGVSHDGAARHAELLARARRHARTKPGQESQR